MTDRNERRPGSADKTVLDIRRATRRRFSAEEKIRIVLEGLRGEETIAELWCKEGINQNLYYRWSKDFLEAGKTRLAGDAVREATSDEVKDLRVEARQLNQVPCWATGQCPSLGQRWVPQGDLFQFLLIDLLQCAAIRHDGWVAVSGTDVLTAGFTASSVTAWHSELGDVARLDYLDLNPFDCVDVPDLRLDEFAPVRASCEGHVLSPSMSAVSNCIHFPPYPSRTYVNLREEK